MSSISSKTFSHPGGKPYSEAPASSPSSFGGASQARSELTRDIRGEPQGRTVVLALPSKIQDLRNKLFTFGPETDAIGLTRLTPAEVHQVLKAYTKLRDKDLENSQYYNKELYKVAILADFHFNQFKKELNQYAGYMNSKGPNEALDIYISAIKELYAEMSDKMKGDLDTFACLSSVKSLPISTHGATDSFRRILAAIVDLAEDGKIDLKAAIYIAHWSKAQVDEVNDVNSRLMRLIGESKLNTMRALLVLKDTIEPSFKHTVHVVNAYIASSKPSIERTELLKKLTQYIANTILKNPSMEESEMAELFKSLDQETVRAVKSLLLEKIVKAPSAVQDMIEGYLGEA